MVNKTKTYTSVITHLEMRERPTSIAPTLPAMKIALLRAEKPTTSFYRYLYNTIGEDIDWYERRFIDDGALKEIIHDDSVEIYIIYVGGVPAGFGEIDCRDRSNIELTYFGLMPEFIGIGIGGYFLRWIIDQAWSYNPRRLWVHTCTEDHANALPTYQKAGFVPFDQETVEVEYTPA